jgi:hypothetical protein
MRYTAGMDLPAEPQLRWILGNTATLIEQGAEPVRGLILPTGEFFPDRFDGTPRAVGALMLRMQEHAGLGDLKVELGVVMPEADAQQAASCSSGACGGTGKIEARADVVRRADGVYRVALREGELKSPMMLATALVRAVSAMFLTEADGYHGVLDSDREALTDLAGTLLGFGVLLANGSYLYMKGCSGVAVHSATRMPVDEVTVALALFCKLEGAPERTAAKHLEPTQREHFDEAAAWAGSNGAVVRLLRRDPAAVRAGDYKLAPSRTWLARVLGVGAKKHARSSDEELADLERAMLASAPKSNGAGKTKTMDAAKAKRLAELKALVDESLEG